MNKFLLAVAALVLSTNAFSLKVMGEKVVTFESLDDYTLCMAQSSGSGAWCHEALKDWVKAHPRDAFKAGKLTRAHMFHWVAVPFFADAFEKKIGQCDDRDLNLALKSAFGQPSDAPAVSLARTIVFEHCQKELQGEFESWVAEGIYEKRNLCPELRKRNMAPAACDK
jgi:hypothetical protein